MKPVSTPPTIKQVKFNGKKDHLPTVAGSKLLCLVSILNNEKCEGPYLKANIETAMKQGFHMTIIMVDLPYAFNLWQEPNPEDLGKKECEKYALRLGRQYLIRNLPWIKDALQLPTMLSEEIIQSKSTDELIQWVNQEAVKSTQSMKLDDQHAQRKQLTPKFEILNWQQWMSRHQTFFEQNQELVNRHMLHPDMQRSIELSSDAYLTRFAQQQNELEKAKSKRYIETETCGLILGAIAANYQFMSYPSKIMPAFDMLIKQIKKDQFFSNVNLEYLVIDFHVQKISSKQSTPDLTPGSVTPELSNEEIENAKLPPAETPLNLNNECLRLIQHFVHDRKLPTPIKAEGVLAILAAERHRSPRQEHEPEAQENSCGIAPCPEKASTLSLGFFAINKTRGVLVSDLSTLPQMFLKNINFLVFAGLMMVLYLINQQFSTKSHNAAVEPKP